MDSTSTRVWARELVLAAQHTNVIVTTSVTAKVQ